MTAAPAAAPAVPFSVEAAERDLLLPEIDRFAASLERPESRARFHGLREAVLTGSLGEEHLAPLQDLLEIALGARSVHRFHGPGAERALLDLYARTPRGAAAHEAAGAANRALEAVRGQRIESLSFRPGLPGSHRLVVETDRCRLTFEVGPAGVAARDVEL